jgi:hypothetical protein
LGHPAGDPELTAEARHLLGLDARKVRYSDGLPDVSGLADELGLDLAWTDRQHRTVAVTPGGLFVAS